MDFPIPSDHHHQNFHTEEEFEAIGLRDFSVTPLFTLTSLGVLAVKNLSLPYCREFLASERGLKPLFLITQIFTCGSIEQSEHVFAESAITFDTYS